jgi:twitching motility protein PilT
MEHVGIDIDRFLRGAWQLKGTDVLLTVGASPAVRVDGELRQIAGVPPIDEARMGEYLAQCMNAEQRARLESDHEVDFAFSWAEVARIRGNAFHQRDFPAIALRIIPNRIPDFEELGLPPTVRNLATLAQGLVLFTGPTGSGKSTSLAALIEWINTNRACHIITIEDPIEYVHDHRTALVSQREVGVDTISFERALRSALREDPDVILVGEMRDPESIAIALTLAETGHLVFSTLHTNDAAQALDRIVDVFPAERQPQIRLQLASTLTAVVAQRLVPRTHGGMVAAFEVLMANSAMRNLVREGKTRQIRNAITMGQGDGMQTLEMDLNRLVTLGYVTREAAVVKAFVPAEID